MSYLDRTTGVWTNLGGLGGYCSAKYGPNTGSPYAMSADGAHSVGGGRTTFCSQAGVVAAVWNEQTGLTNLGSTVPGRAAQARGVNDDGTVVVGYQDGVGRNAAMWVNGVQTTVLTETTEATGVSGDGNFMIGGWWHSFPGDYNTDSIVDAADYTVWRDNLGAPAGTLQNDTDGGIIGQAQYDTWRANYGRANLGRNANGPNHAWRWSLETGIEDLGTLNDDPNVIIPGTATDVNSDDSVIVGYDKGAGSGRRGLG